MKAIKKKLRRRGGETLTEALVSILIIGLDFSMLCTAIVTSARANGKAKNSETAFSLTYTAVEDGVETRKTAVEKVKNAKITVNGTEVEGTVYRTADLSDGAGLNSGYYYYQ